MKEPENSIPTGLDRMSSLLAWWGIPNVIEAGGVEAGARQFQVLVVELNKHFNEAFSNQAQALKAANEQFARALQELLAARQPSELVAAQSRLLTGLMESFAAQVKAWAELTQKLQGCCSNMAGEVAVQAGEKTGHAPLAKPPAEGDQPAVKEKSGRRAA